MYQPHLARKFKLRRFRIEIDRKNGAVLMSMVLEQFGKIHIFKITPFSQNHFSSKMLFIKYIPPTIHVLYIQYMYCTYSTCTVHTVHRIDPSIDPFARTSSWTETAIGSSCTSCNLEDMLWHSWPFFHPIMSFSSWF